MDRVAPDKFMLKRITQKYSDAEIDAFGKAVGREVFAGNKTRCF